VTAYMQSTQLYASACPSVSLSHGSISTVSHLYSFVR